MLEQVVCLRIAGRSFIHNAENSIWGLAEIQIPNLFINTDGGNALFSIQCSLHTTIFTNMRAYACYYPKGDLDPEEELAAIENFIQHCSWTKLC